MDKKLKAKWIAALRSGRFKQHRNQLTGDAPGAYCCLGVLSRLLYVSGYLLEVVPVVVVQAGQPELVLFAEDFIRRVIKEALTCSRVQQP